MNEQEQKPINLLEVAAQQRKNGLQMSSIFAQLADILEIAHNTIAKLAEENAQLKAQIAELTKK